MKKKDYFLMIWNYNLKVKESISKAQSGREGKTVSRKAKKLFLF